MYSYIEDFSDQEEDYDYQNDDEETYNWNHEEKECEEDDSEKNEGTYNLNDEEKEYYNNDEFEDVRNLLDDLDISDKEEENQEDGIISQGTNDQGNDWYRKDDGGYVYENYDKKGKHS